MTLPIAAKKPRAKPAQNGKSPKKGKAKKRDPWDESDEEDDELMSLHSDDSDGSSREPSPPPASSPIKMISAPSPKVSEIISCSDCTILVRQSVQGLIQPQNKPAFKVYGF